MVHVMFNETASKKYSFSHIMFTHTCRMFTNLNYANMLVVGNSKIWMLRILRGLRYIDIGFRKELKVNSSAME